MTLSEGMRTMMNGGSTAVNLATKPDRGAGAPPLGLESEEIRREGSTGELGRSIRRVS